MCNSVGRNDNFLAKARKLSILPTLLDIFDIKQHYIRNLYDFNATKKKTNFLKMMNSIHSNSNFRF